MATKRKYYSSEQKVEIIREHLLEGVSVSDLCDQYAIKPSVFYRWQKTFFEQGSIVFAGRKDRQPNQDKRRIAELEAKLRKKDEVLGEVMEAYVALKKTNGAL